MSNESKTTHMCYAVYSEKICYESIVSTYAGACNMAIALSSKLPGTFYVYRYDRSGVSRYNEEVSSFRNGKLAAEKKI